MESEIGFRQKEREGKERGREATLLINFGLYLFSHLAASKNFLLGHIQIYIYKLHFGIL